jgi:hypothetical protein
MKIGVDRFIDDMRAKGWTVIGPLASGDQQWAIIDEYSVPAGRFAGNLIRIALPIPPDFPATCPAGFYVSPKLIALPEMQSLAVHTRGETASLPGEWQYWSRKFPDGHIWKAGDNPGRLPPHWNGVLSRVI